MSDLLPKYLNGYDSELEEEANATLLLLDQKTVDLIDAGDSSDQLTRVLKDRTTLYTLIKYGCWWDVGNVLPIIATRHIQSKGDE